MAHARSQPSVPVSLRMYVLVVMGMRKNPITWDTDFSGGLSDRGYTMHEHLDDFGLINMNGRVYDPLLGRFLSPDYYVKQVDNSQNYNRYSYALNNPLKYTDPSGEFPIIPIMAAAFLHTSVQIASGNVNSGADFFGSIAVGAAMGYATHGIGELFGPVGSATFSGEIGRSLAHGVSNTLFSGISGHNGNPISTLATGGLGSLGGSAFMMYGGRFSSSPLGVYGFSALSGGLASEFTGGDFWRGAAMGTLNAGLNHLQSVISDEGAKYYSNKKAAYKEMWDKSFTKGKYYALREVSGWELENGGLIMLPYDKNELTISYNDALEAVKIDGKRYVKFNGKNYAIATHAHTHPSMAGPDDHPIGLGQADLDMQKWIGRPINILYNKGVYSVNGTYNYNLNVWDYKYTGTW